MNDPLLRKEGQVEADLALLRDSMAEAEALAGPQNEPAYIRRRDGSVAYYPNGPGPHYTNRAERRNFRGTPHRHDGSKKPTPGRVRNEDWRGAKPKPRPKPKGPRYEEVLA